MVDKNQLTFLIGVGAIVATLGIGTCSTNARIEDGFENVHRRIDDQNLRIGDTIRRVDDTLRRIDETNQRIDELQDSTNRGFDELQTGMRELRRLVETGQAEE